MSTDKKVTTELIECLEDGKKGFVDAAEKLADSDRPQYSTTFREYATQRAEFSAELERMAAAYGDDIDEDGSVVAAFHRGWMSLKDAVSGSDPDGVLAAAEKGEEHAVEEYEEALKKDISPELRDVVQKQLDAIKAAHAEVKRLAEAN